MALKNSGIPSYTWATKPAIANWPSYRPIAITDVGVGGSLWHHNGVIWRPVNGEVTLFQSFGDLTTPIAVIQSGIAVAFSIPGGNPTIPAGMLTVGSSGEMRAYMRRNGVTGASANVRFRLGTAGNSTDSSLWNGALGVTNDLDVHGWAAFGISGANSAFTSDFIDDNVARTNNFDNITTNIDTAAAMQLSIDILNPNAADSFDLVGLIVTVSP